MSGPSRTITPDDRPALRPVTEGPQHPAGQGGGRTRAVALAILAECERRGCAGCSLGDAAKEALHVISER